MATTESSVVRHFENNNSDLDLPLLPISQNPAHVYIVKQKKVNLIMGNPEYYV